MPEAKKLARGTRRRRQQWRDSKRRARAQERAYKEAMRVEAERQRLAPAQVELDGVDLSEFVQSVRADATAEIEDVTQRGDKWRRFAATGIRHADFEVTLYQDDDFYGRKLREWAMSRTPVKLRLERLGRQVYEGPVHVVKVTRHGQVDSIETTTAVLRSAGPPQ